MRWLCDFQQVAGTGTGVCSPTVPVALRAGSVYIVHLLLYEIAGLSLCDGLLLSQSWFQGQQWGLGEMGTKAG